MKPGRVFYVLLLAAQAAWPSSAAQTTVLKPTHEFPLPVREARGKWSIAGDSDAKRNFSFRVVSDRSLLVFDSDTNGQWPLMRVRQWWTDKPEIESIEIPSWGPADKKYLSDVFVDIQVTPNGRYAIAFAGAFWNDKSNFIFHVPHGYVQRKPDTILTVVDLHAWKIVKSMHTQDLANVDVMAVRVLGDGMLGWKGRQYAEDVPLEDRKVERIELLAIPDLKILEECDQKSLSKMGRRPSDQELEANRRSNDATCGRVFRRAGFPSTAALNTVLEMGREDAPSIVKLHSLYDGLRPQPESEAQRMWEAESLEWTFNARWGGYPYYLLYGVNPPFESKEKHWFDVADPAVWYGQKPPRKKFYYTMERFDAQGNLEKSREIRQTMCGDAVFDPKRSSTCGCRVIDANERMDNVLAYCRTQRGDFAGMVRKEWLAITTASSLEDLASIDQTKNRETLEFLAEAEGRSWVVTCELGQMLRVFEVPAAGRNNSN